MQFRTSPALLAIACAAAGSLLLAACGGSSSPPPAAGDEQPGDLARFARCMREHGVEVSAPAGQERALKIAGSGSPRTFEAAQRACQRYRPTAPSMSPAKRIEFQDAALRFARCMREHGVDMPDPEFGPGASVKMHAESGTNKPGLNPASPAFQKAQKACRGLLPGGGPKGLAVGPPPGKGGGPRYGPEIHAGG